MDKDKLLRKYLDGELGPEEEKEALHQIADDRKMRSMLHFELTLNDYISPGSPIVEEREVPEGFSDAVMNRIEAKERNNAQENLPEKFKNWLEQLWIPRTVQWRPAYAFVLAFIVLISLSYPLEVGQENERADSGKAEKVESLDQSVQQVSSESSRVLLRFVYIDDEANSVSVAGDFNNWKPTELTKQTVNGKTVWTALVSMKHGEHDYMFVKNGEKWITDPLAPVQRDDGFGNKNAVIYI